LFAFGLVVAGACMAGEPELNENPGPKTRNPGPAETATPVEYEWGNVRVGGGGYVTGIVFHPLAKDVRYIRTDVGGAYRWDPAKSEWIPMLDNVSTGEQVDGIALDPNKPDRVYVALNDGIYRSEDKGKTWNKLFNLKYSGNATLRWTGECLAVDPLNSAVIYAGSRADGLWRSLNEGATWQKIASVPTGNVRAVVIDQSVRKGDRSAKIYVGLPGGGVYESEDGGDTFAAIGGAPNSPGRMYAAPGVLYITHGRGVAKYSGGVVQDITPAGGEGRNYCGLAVEAGNPDKVIAAQRYSTFNNSIYRSADGGKSWELINSHPGFSKSPEAPWWPDTWFSNATSSLALDPFNPGAFYFTDWFGIWHTPDIWTSDDMHFNTIEEGHEEVVVLTLAAPPAGPALYSGVCDVFGFSHSDIAEFPQKRLYKINEGFSVAFCESKPENIAILGGKGNDGALTILATSSDYGQTWTDRNLPGGERLGKIAISADNPDKMVYAAGTKTGAVYYTADRGMTWKQAAGAPTGAAGLGTQDVWNKDFVLAADGKNGNVFYIFYDGYLHASADGGANWEKRNAVPIAQRGNYMFVQAAPGIEGEVWVSLHSNGLYKTVDGGKTFQKVDAFSSSIAFSWGAPAPGSNVPTAYCYGVKNGVEGMYRSTDKGKTWRQISTSWSSFPAGVKSIAGDRQNFGRVFVGTGGRGIFYGQPSSVE